MILKLQIKPLGFLVIFLLILSASGFAQETYTGEGSVIIEENFQDYVKTRHYLTFEDIGIFQVVPTKDNSNPFRTGDQVTIEISENLEAYSDSEEKPLIYLSDEPSVDGIESKNGLTGMILHVEPAGEISERGPNGRSIIIYLVNWPNNTAPTPDNSAQHMFLSPTSANVTYEETSYGMSGFNSDSNNDGDLDIYGPYQVVRPSNPCDFTELRTMATQVRNMAFQQDGVNGSNWQHRMFVLPQEAACAWAGIATIGCSANDCNVFLDDTYTYWEVLYTHELGHNLGMYHASWDYNNDGTPDYEYGDHSCLMGQPQLNIHNNAPHKIQKDWIPSGRIRNVTSGGIYRIASLETSPSSTTLPLVLRFQVPNSYPLDYYYISYRRGVGLDANLSSQYRDRVAIHRTRGYAWDRTLYLTALYENTSGFVFPELNIRVQQVSHDDETATIRVRRMPLSSPPADEMEAERAYPFPPP